MNRILFLLIFCTFSLSETILIPEDYATIQEGIDASVDGDTVLVANGDYVENLVLDKSIVLTSYAIYDNLDEWIIFDEDFFAQWIINNSHIENTRLIGSSPDDPDYGSVILITPNSEECISPEILGFTIQEGTGTSVVRLYMEEENGIWVPYYYNVSLGGGILADVSNPYIHHNAFIQNGKVECDDDNLRCNSTYSGGAIQLTSSAEDWSFDNRFENYNPRCEVEEFRLSDNLYTDNDAEYGNSMANRFHVDAFNMSGSIFDVFDCSNEESAVSSIWVKVEPAASVDYNDGLGQTCAFNAPDVYVDSSILQECLDEGCGFPNNPFKTITRTLEMISPTEDNPITIHLAEGIYSPETGENYPLTMLSNLNIEGENEHTTILDAQQNSRILYFNFNENNTIYNLTITGGNADGPYPYNFGGGLYLWASNPMLINISIINNNAAAGGGAMSLTASGPILEDVIIENNNAQNGGGIHLIHSAPIFTNVLIDNNIAQSYGGGIFIEASNPIMNNVLISNNFVLSDFFWGGGGGGMYIKSSSPILNYITIVNNTGDGIDLHSSALTLTNSIIWDNDFQPIHSYNSQQPIIIYSDIEGGWEGEGNIDEAPLFTDPENGDYTLQEGSPCIDAGTADIDGDGIDDIADYIGTAPDMGAYEFGESSEIMFGDTNFDGIVDILDIVRIINQIMGHSEFSDYEYTATDFNDDGIIDILDIVQIVNYILAN